MVEPEDGIESRIRDVAHMAPVAHERVDGVVHVLDTVVPPAASVGVGRVREGCVAAGLSNQLVGQGTQPARPLFESTCPSGRSLTAGPEIPAAR